MYPRQCGGKISGRERRAKQTVKNHRAAHEEERDLKQGSGMPRRKKTADQWKA
jgi:hypothetical protein